MKTLLAMMFILSVAMLGYVVHADNQHKKQQALMQVVNDAEHNLTSIQQNPNYIQHTHLTAYQPAE